MRLLLWMSGGRMESGARTPHLLLFVLWALLVGCTNEVEVSSRHLQEGSPSDHQTFYSKILAESHVGGSSSVGSLPRASLPSAKLRQPSQANLTLRLTPPSKLNWASSDNPFRTPIIAAPTFTGQGNCGACWAFVAAHAAQAAVNIAVGDYYRKATGADSRLASSRMPPADTAEDRGPDKLLAPPLSVQELVDCDAQGYNHACEGGDPYWALYYTLNEGLHSRDAYPAYAQEAQRCVASDVDRKHASSRGDADTFQPLRYYVGSVQHLLPSFYASIGGAANGGALPVGVLRSKLSRFMRQMLAEHGPIAIGICGSQSRFLFYAHGVFDDVSCCTSQNHAMLLVGYGEDERSGTKYWLLMNSWGRFWGESGFMRILRYEAEDDGWLRSHVSTDAPRLRAQTQTPSAAELGLCGMFQNPSQAQGGFVLDADKGVLSPSALFFYFPRLLQPLASLVDDDLVAGPSASRSTWQEMWERLQSWLLRCRLLWEAYWEAHWQDALLYASLGLIGLSLLLLAYSFCLDRVGRSSYRALSTADGGVELARAPSATYQAQ